MQENYGVAYGDISGFYTGGFWKYQYKFNADGTYQFVSNAADDILRNALGKLQEKPKPGQYQKL